MPNNPLPMTYYLAWKSNREICMTTLIETAAPTDLLRIADMTPPQVEQVLGLAVRMKANPHKWIKTLRGQSLACFFEKP